DTPCTSENERRPTWARGMQLRLKRRFASCSMHGRRNGAFETGRATKRRALQYETLSPQAEKGSAMYKGSCLCGAVKYEVLGGLGAAVYCHCSRCRKASGSAFASNAVVAESVFKVVQGEQSLRTFSTDKGVHRIFCSACGSPIFSRRDS